MSLADWIFFTAAQSSLLSAILGDINCDEGEVVVHGSIAYAPQHPW